jgi:hypothetical protein
MRAGYREAPACVTRPPPLTRSCDVNTTALATLLSQHPGLETPGGSIGTPLDNASGTPGYSDQAPAEAAADPGTQRENLVTWLRNRQQAS